MNLQDINEYLKDKTGKTTFEQLPPSFIVAKEVIFDDGKVSAIIYRSPREIQELLELFPEFRNHVSSNLIVQIQNRK